MRIINRRNLFFKILLSLALLSPQTTQPYDFSTNISTTANAGMTATIGCGGGAAIGSSFGPVGTIIGIVIGSLICFVVNKYTRKVDHKYDNIWFNDAPRENNITPAKTVDDIIGECEPFKEQRSTKQYIKAGSYEDALKDFESLSPTSVTAIKTGNTGKVGYLADGRTVNVRLESDAGVPTLEIFNPVNQTSIKIRYI